MDNNIMQSILFLQTIKKRGMVQDQFMIFVLMQNAVAQIYPNAMYNINVLEKYKRLR